jgi:hypothetical protein
VAGQPAADLSRAGEAEATFITDRGATDSSSPPRGGIPVTGRLRPPTRLPATAELRERLHHLAAWTGTQTPRKQAVMGDLTKGSREASAADFAELSGLSQEGVPRGLVRCPRCAEWRGRCLDPAPERASLVVDASCRCQNDNRCAACGQLLYELKLNANYYEPADGQIWHVPGFCGFGHKCGPLTPQSD